jgi:hypothetical protein
MSKPKPLTRDEVSGEMQGLFDQVKEVYGLVPNAIGVMARAPENLKAFLALRKVTHEGGILEAKYKELIWLKSCSVNGCLM